MSNYRRLISYIYAYEGEVKGKNIGFAKLETRNNQCKINVSVKKVYVGSNDLQVYLLATTGEIELGKIFIRNGAGEFRTSIDLTDPEHSGIFLDKCYGLTIHDPESNWQNYTTIWEDAVAHAAEVELANVTAENVRKKEEKERVEREKKAAEEKKSQELKEASEHKDPVSPLVAVKPKEWVTQLLTAEVQKREKAMEERMEKVQPWERPATPFKMVSEETNPSSREEISIHPEVMPESQPEIHSHPEAVPEIQPGLQPQPDTHSEIAPNPDTYPEIPSHPETGPEILPLPEGHPELEPQPDPAPEIQPETPAEMPSQPQQPVQPGPGSHPIRFRLQPKGAPRPQEHSRPRPQPGHKPQEPQPESPPASSSGQEVPLPEEPDVEPETMDKGDGELDYELLWEKFSRQYPKIQAFDYENGCEILSIKPQDIGLLPRENWVYGNNSFLLHGYYSYRYLILVRLHNPKGRPRFLLGVPGHYYSNEKHMASMFGFPHFVLSKKQPVEQGRFGYWYTDVKMGNH